MLYKVTTKYTPKGAKRSKKDVQVVFVDDSPTSPPSFHLLNELGHNVSVGPKVYFEEKFKKLFEGVEEVTVEKL